MFNVSAFT